MLCLHGKCPNIWTLRMILVLLIILVCSLSIGLKSSLRRHFNTFMENGKDLPIKGRIKQVPDLCLRLCHSVQQKSMENRSAQVVSGDLDKCACDMSNKETLVKKEPKCPLVTPRLSDRPLPITGLISFPGAGNTWTRHLLQQVSGIGTSSFYCSSQLKANGFPFECLGVSNRTIAVKWHHFQDKYNHVFERVILLMRNPYRNIYAFFNYNRGGLAGYAKAEHYKEWPKFVTHQIIEWQKINSNVLRNYTGPLYILHHENLLNDLKNELGRIFEFLNIAVNATALDCAVINQEGNFHRVKKPVQWRTLYTAEMIRSIAIATGKVSDILESRFGTHLNYSMPED